MEIPYEVRNMFRTFSSLEKQATYQVMSAVMIVDKNVDPREQQIVNEISAAMGLTQADVMASRSLTPETMSAAIRRMPDDKRFLVARAMSTIALADGKVLNIEEAFVQHMAKQLNLDHSWF